MLQTLVQRALSRCSTAPNGCLVWQGGKTRKGYGVIGGPNRSSIYTHRLIYEHHFGPIPAGKLVCHTCDNRSCCNVDHLFLGSAADNSADMVGKGRSCFGEFHPGHILNEDVIPEIRRDRRTLREIAEEHGVSVGAIYHVRKRNSWRHVT